MKGKLTMRRASRISGKVNRVACRAAFFITFAVFLGTGAYAQDPNAQARAHNQSQRDANQNLSELEKGNLARVAASAPQVQEVLLKEPGILVELKRIVAKEASQNGQIVDDSLLADQAIFDRLESDIVFRSIATQLVQKYGYLLPNVNPDSPLAKQQEQILKERARKLVQVESQEDSERSQPYSRLSESRDIDSRETEDRTDLRRNRRDKNCDPTRDNSCDDSNGDLDRTISPQNNQGPDDSPYPRYNSPNRTPYLSRSTHASACIDTRFRPAFLFEYGERTRFEYGQRTGAERRSLRSRSGRSAGLHALRFHRRTTSAFRQGKSRK